MIGIHLIIFFIFAIRGTHLFPFCQSCPTNCDFGTVLMLNRVEKTCFCDCAPNPCDQKICPELHICRVRTNPNCLIGYCNIPKIGYCITMPPPRIFFKQSTITLEFGANFNIEPIIDYNGIPNFKWFKDGRELLPTNAFFFGHVISLVNVNKFDEGVYELILSDEFGYDSAKIEVLVLDPVTIINPNADEIISLYIEQDSMVEIQENLNFNLICLGSNTDNVSYWYQGSIEKLDLILETSETLKIRRAKYTDSGIYFCRITDGISLNVIKVTIKIQQLIPAVARINYEKEIYVNDDLSINCGLSNLENSPVQWYFNGEDPSEYDNLKIDGHKLIINDADFIENGKVSCIKKLLNERFIEETVLLKVIDPYPDVVAVKPRVHSNQGDSAHLKCIVNCVKRCKISWYDPFGIILDSNEEELIIYNVQPINAGKYTCKASNDFGTSQALIDLTVHEYEPKITLEVSPNKLELYPGDKDLVECIVHNDNGHDNHITSIKWIRDNDEEIPDTFKTANNFMYIEALNADDSGEYWCVAKSKNGKEYIASVFINIKKIKENKLPVYLIVKDYSGQILEKGSEIKFGHQLKIECFSGSSDTVQVSWIKESGINRAKVTRVNNQLSVLEISAFTSLDNGKYICSANDSNGIISSSSIEFSFLKESGNLIGFKINGLYGSAPIFFEKTTQSILKREPPRASFVGNKEITAERYSRVEIECRVENSENIEIRKQNGILPENSSEYKNDSYFLILPNIQLKDSGYYECEATNSYGVSKDAILLTVYDLNTKNNSTEEKSIDDYDDYDDYNDEYEDDYRILRLSAQKEVQQPKKPEVKIFGPKEVTLNEGDLLEIVCQVNYSLNAELIHHGDDNYNDQVKKLGNIYSLKFNNVTKSHSGYYTCTAFNDYGVVRDHVYVNIIEKQKLENWNDIPLVKIMGPKNLLINEGDNIEINCHVLGAKKVFFKNENDLSQNIQSSKKDDIYSVVIDQVKLSGYFICTGDNDYGSKSDYVYVIVKSKQNLIEQPALIQTTNIASLKKNLKFSKLVANDWIDIPRVEILGQKKIEKNKGSSYEIVCEVKGASKIEFRKFNEIWPESYESENIGDIYKLKLNNLKEEDSGYYQCFSSNGKGHSFDYVQIIVNGNEDNNVDF